MDLEVQMTLSRLVASRRFLPVSLTCVSLALLVGAGLALLLAPDSTTTGKVIAMGWNGEGSCYPTVRYQVDGETYRTTPRRDQRWCDYEWGGPATVFYDPDAPEDGRLDKYGDTPKWLAGAGLASFLAALFLASRRTTEEPRRRRVAAPSSR